jgi:hypothetical protein
VPETRPSPGIETGSAGLHAILDVVLEGQKTTHSSILKDYQVDPIRGRIDHFDLQEVRLDQPIQTAVVVELVGESVGAKAGGVLSQVAREVRVEALPLEVPERLELDVSAMEIGESLRLSDLTTPEGVHAARRSRDRPGDGHRSDQGRGAPRSRSRKARSSKRARHRRARPLRRPRARRPPRAKPAGEAGTTEEG